MMQRRAFSHSLALIGGAAALGVAQAQTPAPRGFKEGSDYIELDKRAPVEAPAGRIEVVEFFWYSCPHCNSFEPRLEAWIKNGAPKDAAVRRVPVAFRDDFVPQQKLFYALEALNRLGDLHAKVFQAIHVEKQQLARDEAIVAWAEKQGVARATFTEAYNSFGVATKARRAAQLQEAYKVSGVPALGVAGRYYTDGAMAGTMDRALQVAEFLIGEARKQRT
jgi:protein dithiol oxidoreductase (disulfide-forming)